MKIQDHALLVKLRIESWGTSRKDKDANRAVAAAKESLETATSVSKRLVPPDSLKAVKSEAEAAREYIRTITSPWAEDGGRLLDARQFFAMNDELRRNYKPAWEREVAAFIARLPYFRDEWGPQALGQLYNDSLYPTPEEMEREFVWELQTLPLNPDSRELRVILGNEYVEQIQAEAEARLVSQLCERIAEPIANMVRRLNDPEAAFKNTLVENVREIAALIPALNLTNDPDLAALQRRILGELTQYSPEALRVSPTARSQTARKAQAILDNLAGYLPDAPDADMVGQASARAGSAADTVGQASSRAGSAVASPHPDHPGSIIPFPVSQPSEPMALLL